MCLRQEGAVGLAYKGSNHNIQQIGFHHHRHRKFPQRDKTWKESSW